jgi:hypothetical protein
MDEKNPQAPSTPNLPPAVCTPPSHPTTLGDVWSGISRTPEAALLAALRSQGTSWPSEKPGSR